MLDDIYFMKQALIEAIDGTEESYPYLRNAIRIMNPPVK